MKVPPEHQVQDPECTDGSLQDAPVQRSRPAPWAKPMNEPAPGTGQRPGLQATVAGQHPEAAPSRRTLGRGLRPDATSCLPGPRLCAQAGVSTACARPASGFPPLGQTRRRRRRAPGRRGAPRRERGVFRPRDAPWSRILCPGERPADAGSSARPTAKRTFHRARPRRSPRAPEPVPPSPPSVPPVPRLARRHVGGARPLPLLGAPRPRRTRLLQGPGRGAGRGADAGPQPAAPGCSPHISPGVCARPSASCRLRGRAEPCRPAPAAGAAHGVPGRRRASSDGDRPRAPDATPRRCADGWQDLPRTERCWGATPSEAEASLYINSTDFPPTAAATSPP